MTVSSIRKRLDRLWRLQESLGHQRIVGSRVCQTFVSLACYDLEGQLRSVVLEDGTCLEGEEASLAMEDLADPRHTRVVRGIDLGVVLGEKVGGRLSCFPAVYAEWLRNLTKLEQRL